MFHSGTIDVDLTKKNNDCAIIPSFIPNIKWSTYRSSSGNTAVYFAANPSQWDGSVKLFESSEVSSFEGFVSFFDETNQEFEITFLIPSCGTTLPSSEPSTVPSFDDNGSLVLPSVAPTIAPSICIADAAGDDNFYVPEIDKILKCKLVAKKDTETRCGYDSVLSMCCKTCADHALLG